MKINILKCHGAGNDFILIDEMNNDYNLSDEQRKNIAVTYCNRESSVGADGILFVEKSSKCDARMRIFNSDGTEPEMCGNGLRCVGRYVMESLKKNKIRMETMKAEYDVKMADNIYSGVKTVEIIISSINFEPQSLPMVCSDDKFLFHKIEELSDELIFSAVSITNPHIVSFVENIDIPVLEKVGKKANNCPAVFPKGVNVNFVKALGENNIYVKTYERGVGLTKSCGTGMTASSIISCAGGRQKFGSVINIYNDGGMIKCSVSKDESGHYSVRFIGNATYVFTSFIGTDFIGTKKIGEYNYDKFTDEAVNYDKFLTYTRKIIEK